MGIVIQQTLPKQYRTRAFAPIFVVRSSSIPALMGTWRALPSHSISAFCGVLVTCGTDPFASTTLKPPCEWGPDNTFGNSTSFGVPPGYGGFHAAFSLPSRTTMPFPFCRLQSGYTRPALLRPPSRSTSRRSRCVKNHSRLMRTWLFRLRSNSTIPTTSPTWLKAAAKEYTVAEAEFFEDPKNKAKDSLSQAADNAFFVMVKKMDSLSNYFSASWDVTPFIRYSWQDTV